jgi:hypothetical protein
MTNERLPRGPLARFAADEAAAVTVDWVVLTAATVGLGLATTGVMVQGVSCLTQQTGGAVEEVDIMTSFAHGAARSNMRASQTSIGGAGADSCAKPEATYVKYGGQHISGPADLSGDYALTWDEDGLTVTTLVNDDSVLGNDTNLNWQGDSVEIYLDMANDGGSTYNDDDFQLVVSAAGDDDIDLHRNGGFRTDPPEGITSTVVRTDTGYQTTMTASWEALGMSGPPEAGTEIGFAVAVNDRDAGQDRTRAAMMFGTESEEAHHGPEGFNTMTLD